MDVLEDFNASFRSVHLGHIVVQHDDVVVVEWLATHKVNSLLPVLSCVHDFKVLGQNSFDIFEDEGAIVGNKTRRRSSLLVKYFPLAMMLALHVLFINH